MSTFEEVIAAAKETGFHVDEDGSMWDHNDYVEQDDCGMQDLGDKVNHRYTLAFEAGRQAELEECCAIVFGQCGSDNVAHRTVDAIRARGTK